MRAHLADTSVLLDVVTRDPVWSAWSVKQLHLAAGSSSVLINPFIYAELAPAFRSETALESWFRTTQLQRAPLPYAAAWPAAEAFARYKKAGGPRTAARLLHRRARASGRPDAHHPRCRALP